MNSALPFVLFVPSSIDLADTIFVGGFVPARVRGTLSLGCRPGNSFARCYAFGIFTAVGAIDFLGTRLAIGLQTPRLTNVKIISCGRFVLLATRAIFLSLNHRSAHLASTAGGEAVLTSGTIASWVARITVKGFKRFCRFASRALLVPVGQSGKLILWWFSCAIFACKLIASAGAFVASKTIKSLPLFALRTLFELGRIWCMIGVHQKYLSGVMPWGGSSRRQGAFMRFTPIIIAQEGQYA